VLAGLYYFLHLERTPESGRLRFMDVTANMEEAHASEVAGLLQDEYRSKILPPEHPLTMYVTSIVSAILEASDLGHVATADDQWATKGSKRVWKIMVIDDPKTMNAMASWGHIIVFTGILPVCANASGLAGIVGHEIAHVTLRHQSETLSLTRALSVLQFFIDYLGFDMGLSRLFTWLLMDLPNSRQQETEADAVGMKYAAKACFDPGEIPGVFARLQELEKNVGLDLTILRTHPTGTARNQALGKLLPGAYDIRAANERCADTANYFDAFRNSISLPSNRQWSDFAAV